MATIGECTLSEGGHCRRNTKLVLVARLGPVGKAETEAPKDSENSEATCKDLSIDTYIYIYIIYIYIYMYTHAQSYVLKNSTL